MPKLIPLDVLKAGIVFAMKENLMVQMVYPDYELPQEYKDTIDSIDHSDIVPYRCKDKCLTRQADIVVLNSWEEIASCHIQDNIVYVVRTSKSELFEKHLLLKELIAGAARLNIVITDVETFTEKDFGQYEHILKVLSAHLEALYVQGKTPQLNLLTDRMMLTKMNNCNAGWENITLAPDGKFYVCPAFYLADDNEEFGLGKVKYNIGSMETGLDIRNPQQYRLDHAPLCRNCDAYQCKRCVWLNRKTTYELNTPSHEQCVVAHLERNGSRELLLNIRSHGAFLPDKEEIEKLDYLDPFEKRKQW